ncbi:DUF58 domain-containing protein [Pseudomonas sp. TTU2014-080ASC]|uniref:DUF58 domain-containing protein n=1 Tax=Pseudomonas sp. TTU2014-080ASC TaxID=1729724 RepID=UPI0007188D2E|nr:DUF58 domain-containing protein [Pseudomonas sp. TTU2014-080ASC]KRW62640.1 hypothetical protein AO726_04270 [Pseudomonas sp. TTU2014-080ASC]
MKPSRALILCLAALFVIGCLLGIASAVELKLPALIDSLYWGLLIALASAALLDALWLRRLPSPRIERQLPGNLPLGRWSEVTLVIHHPFSRPTQLEIFDHLPGTVAFENLPLSVDLRPGEHTQSSYRVRPLQRGHITLPRCEIGLHSPLGLWRGRRYLPIRGESKVYPDFARLYGAQLMAVEDWVNQLGIRQHQRRGLGMEFHQLREFRDGDTLRQIDWKATARKRTPIAREYQDERDQQIIFLLDCGRRMRSHDGELAHFDHALNACLLLSYVALRQGDAVGLATFATHQQRFLPPAKGQSQLNVLLNGLYDLDSTQQPADFSAAISDLLKRQRRRALVVLVSNLRDEDDQELLGAVKRLSQQHRVLIASLREDILDTLRQTPVDNFDAALDYCGGVNYLTARAELHERLIANRVPVLDVRPGELGPQLVNSYLTWKKAGTL